VGFMLNQKIVLGARKIKFLWHYFSSREITVVPDLVKSIRQIPLQRNLCSASRFLGIVSFYAQLISKFLL
jgi:hypothetical protein